jgi:hypothetical protein
MAELQLAVGWQQPQHVVRLVRMATRVSLYLDAGVALIPFGESS